MDFAKAKIESLGYEVTSNLENRLDFVFKGRPVSFWPYTGWHTGSTIKDGRGLENLLKQIKPC
jgi:hypothetical protein